MPENVFEGTKLTFKNEIRRGKPTSQDVQVKFEQQGGAEKVPDAEVTLGEHGGFLGFFKTKDTEAVYSITLPKCTDTEENYTLKYWMESNKEKYDGKEFTVWPASVDATVYDKDDEAKVLPNARFRLTYSTNEQQLCTANGEGKLTARLIQPGVYTAPGASPYVFTKWKDGKDKGRQRELVLEKKKWQAKIKKPGGGKTKEAPLKWYVNQPKDQAAAKGTFIKLEIGAEDTSLALKDEEINVRATFPKANSKRNSPVPSLCTGEDTATAVAMKVTTAKPGVDDLVYEAKIKIPADGQDAVVYLHLGVCGGDTCQVEVGVTDTYEDDKLFVENWRKVGLAHLIPLKAKRQTSTLLGDDDGKVGVALDNAMKKIFEGTFIEFYTPATGSGTFDTTDVKHYLKGTGGGFTNGDVTDASALVVPAAKYCNEVYEGGQWKKKALAGGANVFLMSSHQRRKIRGDKFPGVTLDDDTMGWTWMDLISARSKTSIARGSAEWTSDLGGCTNSHVTSFEGKAEKTVELAFHVFEKDPIVADGRVGLAKVQWRALRYRKKGASSWTAVSGTTPGSAYRNFTDVVVGDATEMAKWCEITDSRNVKLKLKADADTDPGKVMAFKQEEDVAKSGGGTEKKQVEYDLDIQLSCEFYGCQFTVLGGAVAGEGQLQTTVGSSPAEGMANVLAHEVAHNLGQTYMAAVGGEVGGWSGSAIGGVPFDAGVPTGQYYVGHGHQGSHCAKPLFEKLKTASSTDKTKYLVNESFQTPSDDARTKYFSKITDDQQCIMWGSADPDATKTRKFCDECKTFIKANDLSNIKKTW